MDIRKEKAISKIVRLVSCDRYGLELELDVVTEKYKITLCFHKKRSSNIFIEINNIDTDEQVFSKLFSSFDDLIINDVLSMFPRIITKFVYDFSNKWTNLTFYATELMKVHNKHSYVSIFIKKNEFKTILFNHKHIMQYYLLKI